MAPPLGDSGGPNPSVILITLLRQNDTNCYTNAEVTRGGIVTRPPLGGPFSLQISVFSSLEGTKPCFSFGKRTLGLHGPPMGPFWWSKSLGNSYYFQTWMTQNHAFPLENPHFSHLGSRGAYNEGQHPLQFLLNRYRRAQIHAFLVQN